MMTATLELVVQVRTALHKVSQWQPGSATRTVRWRFLFRRVSPYHTIEKTKDKEESKPRLAMGELVAERLGYRCARCPICQYIMYIPSRPKLMYGRAFRIPLASNPSAQSPNTDVQTHFG